MRLRNFILQTRSSSFSKDSTDSESPKASPPSLFKGRPFPFQRRCSQKAVASKVANKKTVSFAPLVSVIHVQSYAETMKDELWYSKEDIQTIKKKNCILVNQYKSGYFFESNMNTFLGLEQYLIFEEARFRRDCVYDAVLGLQDRWKEKSFPSDAERLAKVYRRVLQRTIVSE